MGFTKEEMMEFEAFDYASLFNQELEDLEDTLEIPEEKVYHKAVTLNNYSSMNVSGAMEIHLNRLEQLLSEDN
mgnify:FL=1|tara:strand:- start:10 stop:228 length:219 start_codon:yes stop_codon:yes gene_type:complete